jgi:hypothetical protein
VRQQCLGTTGLLFDPLMTALRERAITGKVMIPLRLGYIDKLLTAHIRPVERYWFNRHFFRAIF